MKSCTLIRIFEEIDALPLECKEKLLLNSRMTEGDFHLLKLEIPDGERVISFTKFRKSRIRKKDKII